MMIDGVDKISVEDRYGRSIVNPAVAATVAFFQANPTRRCRSADCHNPRAATESTADTALTAFIATCRRGVFSWGKRDPSDTSNIVVALREAQEETALNPFDVKLLGDLPIMRARSGLSVKPIVGLIPAQVDLTAQPTEIDRIFFAPLQDLIDAPPLPYEVRLARQSLYFPSMQVESEVVWGLTARMLVSLFQYGLGYQKKWPFLVNPPHFGVGKF